MSVKANPDWFASAMNKAVCDVGKVSETNEKKPAGERLQFDEAIKFYNNSIRAIEREIAFWMIFKAQIDTDKTVRNEAMIESIGSRIELLTKVCEGTWSYLI